VARRYNGCVGLGNRSTETRPTTIAGHETTAVAIGRHRARPSCAHRDAGAARGVRRMGVAGAAGPVVVRPVRRVDTGICDLGALPL